MNEDCRLWMNQRLKSASVESVALRQFWESNNNKWICWRCWRNWSSMFVFFQMDGTLNLQSCMITFDLNKA